MMRHFKTILVSILYLLVFSCKKDDVSVEQTELFVKYYGGAIGNHAYDVKQTADGGYVLAGVTTTDNGNTDVILIKTDAKGIELWSKTFGGDGNDDCRSLQIMADGGYVLLGTYGGSTKDLYLIKTDASGNATEAQIGYKSATDEEGFGVQICPDGDFLLVGSTTGSDTSSASADKNLFLVKMSSDLITKRWTALKGGVADDIGYYVQIKNDKTFFIVGKTSSYGLAGSNIWTLLAYSNTSNIPPTITPLETYGSAEDDEAVHCQRSVSDTSFAVIGSQGGNVYLSNFVLTGVGNTVSSNILNIDYNGSSWPRLYGASGSSKTIGRSAQPTSDGGYIVLATTIKSGSDYDQYLVKTDANGNQVWEQFFGSAGKDEASTVIQTSDGGYAIAGSTEFKGNTMISLIKVTAEGKLQK